MKYTKEIPTKPGWYWVRPVRILPFYFPKGVYQIIINLGKPVIDMLSGGRITFDDRFEYAGPIEEPEE